VATMLSLALFSIDMTERMESSAFFALFLAVIGAIAAAYAGWHATDRIIAWRGRPEPEED
jgi:hypothetical protein